LNILHKIWGQITSDLDFEEDQGDFGPLNQQDNKCQDFGRDGAWTSTTAVFTRSLPRFGPRTMTFVLRARISVLKKER
jgi:hypothetical protein